MRLSKTALVYVLHSVLICVAALAAQNRAFAQPSPSPDSGEPALVSLGAGYYDFNRRKDTAADFRLEYRHGEKLWLFKPWAGLELTADGAVYGLAGLLVDVYFGRRLVVTPSFGAGLYHNGNGRDLGNEVEFRSQVELAWRFNDQSRLGIAISHISNAGIANRNPGAEVLNVYYSISF